MNAPLLFTIFIAFLIGRRVARDVPDEIAPARGYLSLAPDALLLVMAALALPTPLVLILIPVWILCRVALKERSRYAHAPVSGILLAIGGAHLAVLAILCIAMNYVIGALAADMRDATTLGVGQPLAAACALLLL